MTTKIDWDKPIETEQGWRAEVLCADLKDVNCPVVVRVTEPRGNEVVWQLTKYGAPLLGKTPCIRNIPEKRRLTGWVNVYKGNEAALHPDKYEAAKFASSDRIACIPIYIEYEVGEGLA